MKVWTDRSIGNIINPYTECTKGQVLELARVCINYSRCETANEQWNDVRLNFGVFLLGGWIDDFYSNSGRLFTTIIVTSL